MGYRCQFDGVIIIPQTFEKNVTELLDDLDIIDEMYIVSPASITPHGDVLTEINISNSDLNFHEEDWHELMLKLRNYNVMDGTEIEFIGEDDQHWKYIWDTDEWQEHTGTIVYHLTVPKEYEFLEKYDPSANFTTSSGLTLTPKDIREVLDYINIQNGLMSLRSFCENEGININKMCIDENLCPENICKLINEKYENALRSDSGKLEMECVKEVLNMAEINTKDYEYEEDIER